MAPEGGGDRERERERERKTYASQLRVWCEGACAATLLGQFWLWQIATSQMANSDKPEEK